MATRMGANQTSHQRPPQNTLPEPFAKNEDAMRGLVRAIARLFGSDGSRLVDFQDAVDAFERGDYDAALPGYLSAAEAGYVAAQYDLAVYVSKEFGRSAFASPAPPHGEPCFF